MLTRISLLENTRKYRFTPKGILTNMYDKQRARSKARGLPPPSYSLNELHKLFLGDSKFNRLYREWVEHGCNSNLKPSIDRINRQKPYTLGNIHIVTWGENRFKETMEMRRRKGEVLQFNTSGLLLGRYKSQREAVMKTGISQGNMSEALNGRRSRAGGFKWAYRGEVIGNIYENPELLGK